MANRCFDNSGEGEAEVNPFLFNKSRCPQDLKIKEFKSNNWEWAEFVMMNRDKTLDPPFEHGYDVVIGPVADSRVDDVIAKYKEEFGINYRGRDNLAILARRLKYAGEKYTQYCFCTTKSIELLIRD